MRTFRPGVIALLMVAVFGGFVAVGAGTAVVGFSSSDAGLAASDQTTVVSNQNTTNYLSPVNSETDGYESIGLDVSAAATVTAHEISAEHHTRTFDEQLQGTDAAERHAIAQEQLDAIENRFEEIDERQQQLFNAYTTGSIDSRELLKDLVALQFAAEADVANYDRAIGETTTDVETQSQLETLAEGLTATQPVTDQAANGFTDPDETVTVYVQGNTHALVLGTAERGMFTRQAMLHDERDFDGEDRFKLDQGITIEDEEWFTPAGYSEAQSRLSDLYPWAYDGRQVSANVQTLSRIYQLSIEHEHGTLETYFDGATKNVFHENQYQPINLVPIEGTISNSTADLTVELGLTRPSGPMRVSVTDDGSAVADGTVKVNDQPVGTTDSSGERWTVQPMDPFEVTVETPDGDTVTVEFP